MLRYESSADAMGSTYSVVLYDEDRNKMQTAADHALEEARRLDNLLSNYKPESEWSKVNREASAHPVRISNEVFDLLAACMEYSRRSEGAFDISVGPLMKIWGFYKGTGHMPKPGEIDAARRAVGYRHIVLDRAAHTVYFDQPGFNIDPGGIGKGYAVDRMVDILRRAGIRNALISAAGSSIYCLGQPPGESGWRIQIEDPKDEGRPSVVGERARGRATEAVLKNESISTSGSSEKFFVADGKVWSHIMDPRTGYPARGVLSVSVIAPRTLDTEAWTKPYFVNGRKWTQAHKPSSFRVFYCEDKAEQPCAWLQ
jgi:thiamine biosynthesis lipoprotein